jgi:hypothetical protein
MNMRALLLFVVTLAFGVAPFVTPPFTGFDPGQFPVRIDRPSIQPAGYAFAIWSVIYTWLFLHAIAGLWKFRENPAWDAVRAPLILSIAVGAVWLSIATASPIWATITIWIMAASALTAFLRADTGTNRWLLSAPLGIYAGWLSAAAAVSTGVLIAGYGLLSDTGSAVAILALILALATIIQMKKPAMPIYGLTVIWALAGVMVVNWGQNTTVAIIAASGIAVMTVTLVAARRAAT